MHITEYEKKLFQASANAVYNVQKKVNIKVWAMVWGACSEVVQMRLISRVKSFVKYNKLLRSLSFVLSPQNSLPHNLFRLVQGHPR